MLSVSAAPVTDTVIVGAQEWAQVDLFTNVSWNTLNSQCPGGVCTLTSSVNGYDLSGWTWASIDTVQAFFNGITGQATVAPGTNYELASAWAPAFTALCNPTNINSYNEIVQGFSSDTYIHDVNEGYAPLLSNVHSITNGWASTTTATFEDKDTGSNLYGAWIFRDAQQAPVPATLTLFTLGLASMWGSRRRRSIKA